MTGRSSQRESEGWPISWPASATQRWSTTTRGSVERCAPPSPAATLSGHPASGHDASEETGGAVSTSGWAFDGPADRSTIVEEIRNRAAAARGAPLLTSATGNRGRSVEIAPSAPLRRLRPVPPPAPVSARPGVSLAKKVIRRLVAWEIDPLRDQLNRLQRAAVDAVDAETELVMSRESTAEDPSHTP